MHPQLPDATLSSIAHIREAIENEQCQFKNSILREIIVFIDAEEAKKKLIALQIYYMISQLPNMD